MDQYKADVLKTLIQSESGKEVTKEIIGMIKGATKQAPFWLSLAVSGVLVIWVVHPATANALLTNILKLLQTGGHLTSGVAKRAAKGIGEAASAAGKAIATAATASATYLSPKMRTLADDIQNTLENFFHPRRRLHWRLNIYLYVLAMVAFLVIGVKCHGTALANTIFAFGAIMFLSPALLLALVLNQLRPKEAR